MKSAGPDGLEAWIVALSAGFINFVMAGLGRMSGILYVVLIKTFSVGRMEASVPFSARSLTRNLLGPLVGIIGQKYGVRAATLLGGIIGTISAACCFYSYSMLWITIMWGVANGIGTALSITLPQVVLAMHFKKHKTTASGISVSGGCIGSFMFPALLEFLIWTYGLGGTFLILSGIVMNVIPAAILLDKPSWMKRTPTLKTPRITINAVDYRGPECRSDVNTQQRLTGYSNSALENDDSIDSDASSRLKSIIESLQENKSRILQLTIKYYVQKNGLRENKNKLMFIEDNMCLQIEWWLARLERKLRGCAFGNQRGSVSSNLGSKSPKSISGLQTNHHKLNNEESTINELFLQVPETAVEKRPNDFQILLNHMLSEDRSKLSTLFNNEIDLDLLDQVREVNYFSNRKTKPPALAMPLTNTYPELPGTKKSPSNTFMTHIKTAFRLHVNPLFLLVSLSRSVHFLCFVPAVTIIVDFAMDKGLPVEDGKYVIAALSAGDLMGRLCLGWVTDRGYMSLPRYVLLVMVIQGLCTASLGFLRSRVALLIGITLFGLLQGSLFVRHPVLVSKYLRGSEQSVAMGCINFLSGCIGFTFPSYIGYFRDTIGLYDYMFCINGGIGVLVGLLWFFEPFFWSRWQPGPDSG